LFFSAETAGFPEAKTLKEAIEKIRINNCVFMFKNV